MSNKIISPKTHVPAFWLTRKVTLELHVAFGDGKTRQAHFAGPVEFTVPVGKNAFKDGSFSEMVQLGHITTLGGATAFLASEQNNPHSDYSISAYAQVIENKLGVITVHYRMIINKGISAPLDYTAVEGDFIILDNGTSQSLFKYTQTIKGDVSADLFLIGLSKPVYP